MVGTERRMVRMLAVLVAMALATFGLQVVGAADAPPAGAAGTGTIEGTVEDPSSVPLEGVEVTFVGTLGEGTFSVSTGVDGSYESDQLPVGGYTVHFDPTGWYGFQFLPEYYDGAATVGSATPVTVLDSVATTGVDATLALAPPTSISGNVTDPNGDPLADVEVNVDGNIATTNSGGDYTVDGLVPGNHFVHFFAPVGSGLANQWYDGAASLGLASEVSVVAYTDTPGIDAQLWVPGSISGRVTNRVGEPVEGAGVSSPGCDCGVVETGADGLYTLPAVVPGDNVVHVAAPDGSFFVDQWYDGAATIGEATPVPVVAGQDTPDIDVHLFNDGPGSFSGTVTTSETFTPVAGVEVIAGGGAGSAFTDVNGWYELVVAEPGSYTVRFAPLPGSGLSPIYYDEVSSENAATPVVVYGGEDTHSINAVLLPDTTGSISGRVTDPNGDGVASVGVYADTDECSACGSAVTDANGYYSIVGLAPDSYRVSFEPGEGPLAPEFYDGSFTPGEATPVAVVGGEDTPGINAQLVVGGTISGTVTDAEGNPLPDTPVIAEGVTTCACGIAMTDANGDYTITGLPPDDYVVYFSAPVPGLYNQYYEGVPDEEMATHVPVLLGEDTPGIDAVLTATGSGGGIAGLVTAPGGLGMPDVVVIALQGGSEVASTTTDPSGRYAITGLDAGDYVVHFVPDQSTLLVEQYWNGVRDLSEATPVTVIDGFQTRGIDAALIELGKITGTVTDPDGDPVADVFVYGIFEDCPCVAAITDEFGNYTLEGLYAGNWIVGFSPDPETGFVEQFYDGVIDPELATEVLVADGTVVPGIDAELVVGGSISGRVTDANGDPVADVYVEADTGCGCGFAVTAADGTYVITGLAAGAYVVMFDPTAADSELGIQYYDGAVAPELATPVAVVLGADTPGIDAQLGAPRGAVMGVVTVSGTPLAGATVRLYDATATMVASTVTDGSGAYDLAGLEADGYTVLVRDNSGVAAPNWWYGGSTVHSGATAFGIVAGLATPVDVDVPPLSSMGSVTGVVTVSGSPLAGATVRLYAASQIMASTVTDGSGAYTLNSPAGSGYTVLVRDASGVGVPNWWYGGAAVQSGAAPVTITGGGTTTADVAVPSAASMGSVAGVVTVSGSPLAGATVRLYGTAGQIVASTTTDGSGAYSLGAPAGSGYTVLVRDMSGVGVPNWWYVGSLSRTSATPVAVSSGGTTAVNVSVPPLASTGTVAGIITVSGSPLAGATVRLYNAAGQIVGSTVTDSSGAYQLSGTAGTGYGVLVRDMSGVGVPNWWYGGSLVRSGATDVTITAGGTTTVDVAVPPLASLGTVSGAITVSGAPLVGATVRLYGAAGQIVASTVTDGSGGYSLSVPAASDYRLMVKDSTGVGVPAWWYVSAPTRNTATPITVVAGGTFTANVSVPPL